MAPIDDRQAALLIVHEKIVSLPSDDPNRGREAFRLAQLARRIAATKTDEELAAAIAEI